MQPAYRTALGACYLGKAEEVLDSGHSGAICPSADLVFTSPPFPLNRKKAYSNLTGDEYVEWLASFAPVFARNLTPSGSIVMELGNAWEPGRPVMSTLALRALLAFLERGRLNLCQQFVWYNPARLPSPAQWVNVERIRVKDAFTHIWWMSPTDRPKADNRRVLKEYSQAMRRLLSTGRYNPGPRPSEHSIGKHSFLADNSGAIPPNVITAANTAATGDYLEYCRRKEIVLHPARMPIEVAEFFIKFLTEPDDMVLDPFAGSNTTGAVAEALGRRWVAIEPERDYVRGSVGRFRSLSEESV